MRVFILEDCEIFRLSLMLILSQEPDIEVVGAIGSNSDDICNQIIASKCEALLVGLRLRNRSGLEIAREIKQVDPNIPVLALGFSTDASNIAEMKQSGINVFVPMHSSNEYIANKIRHARESLDRCDFSAANSSSRVSIIPGNPLMLPKFDGFK